MRCNKVSRYEYVLIIVEGEEYTIEEVIERIETKKPSFYRKLKKLIKKIEGYKLILSKEEFNYLVNKQHGIIRTKIKDKECNLNELAMEYNIPVSTIRNRWNKNLRGEELIKYKRESKRIKIELELEEKEDNKLELTVKDIARLIGATTSSIYTRIKKGIKGEKLIERKLQGGGVLIEIEGESKTIPEWAKEYNIPRRTINRRVEIGIVGKELIYKGRLKQRKKNNL